MAQLRNCHYIVKGAGLKSRRLGGFGRPFLLQNCSLPEAGEFDLLPLFGLVSQNDTVHSARCHSSSLHDMAHWRCVPAVSFRFLSIYVSNLRQSINYLGNACYRLRSGNCVSSVVLSEGRLPASISTGSLEVEVITSGFCLARGFSGVV